MYSRVVVSAAKLMRHPTLESSHQFGLRAIAFFSLIFVWIVIAPVRVSREPNARLRKLQFAVTVAVALVQIILGVQFLRELRSATSIEQVRTSMGMLLYAALALYLFLVAKMLLPRTVLDNDALSAKEQSNGRDNSFGP